MKVRRAGVSQLDRDVRVLNGIFMAIEGQTCTPPDAALCRLRDAGGDRPPLLPARVISGSDTYEARHYLSCCLYFALLTSPSWPSPPALGLFLFLVRFWRRPTPSLCLPSDTQDAAGVLLSQRHGSTDAAAEIRDSSSCRPFAAVTCCFL
ncbi:hypothetical protein E2C01_077408 [Portunus trituberculatus]|uniref:Uncharacterized protein n=1 Tax=Portunus trituberculatus TaxID=210409 RepID=A0A5B7IR86_PORTR|nr:hypothetical protein [Portunus trituberculatus]